MLDNLPYRSVLIRLFHRQPLPANKFFNRGLIAAFRTARILAAVQVVTTFHTLGFHVLKLPTFEPFCHTINHAPNHHG